MFTKFGRREVNYDINGSRSLVRGEEMSQLTCPIQTMVAEGGVDGRNSVVGWTLPHRLIGEDDYVSLGWAELTQLTRPSWAWARFLFLFLYILIPNKY